MDFGQFGPIALPLLALTHLCPLPQLGESDQLQEVLLGSQGSVDLIEPRFAFQVTGEFHHLLSDYQEIRFVRLVSPD